jgi:RluA family pseudouridine synthase
MNLSKNVLWHDDHLLVVNKAPGILVIADGYDPTAPYLTNLLEDLFGCLWPVHRLDRDTSGILVLARTAAAHRELNRQFERRLVNKVYHALVNGRPPWDERTLKLPLRTNADRRHRTKVDHSQGKPSITHLQFLEEMHGFSLIEARPETGRRHQIRVHLAACGFPILVDDLYGDSSPIYLSHIKPAYKTNPEHELPILTRLGLHASSLRFKHPDNGTELAFQAPYADDLLRLFAHLRK